MTSSSKHSLYFKVNAEAKSIIGKDLINNDSIAILELVKNAYDAGSPHVNITFNNIKEDKEKSVLTIEDQGHGMSLDDIENKWLNIAYSEKKKKVKSVGRRVAGNKGVGRFSCDRLGKHLNLYTRTSDGKIICLSIDWERFEGVGQFDEINSISNEYRYLTAKEFEQETGCPPFRQGTFLQILELRSDWTKNKLIALRRELERFANPHQDAELNSFSIKLSCPEYKKDDVDEKEHHKNINGYISSTIIDDLHDRTSSIESSIDKDGASITTTLNHRGQRLFTLIEKNIFPHLKNIKIKILYLGPRDKALFTRRMGYQAVQFGSIFLFLGGFRISPYGEPTNDWLGIDQRKQQKVRDYLGTRDVLGRIEIDDDAEEDRWRIVSNREGLVQTPAYHDLVRTNPSGYFWRVFRKLQRYVVEGLDWDSVLESRFELESKVLNSKNPGDVKVTYQRDETAKETALIGLLKGLITAGGTLLKDVELIEFDPSLAAMLKRQKDEQVKAFFKEFEAFAGKGSMTDNYQKNLKKLHEMVAEERKGKEKLQEERDEAIKVAAKAKQQAKEATERAQQAETKAKAATAKAEKVEQVNLFLKATSSQDVSDMVNMQHQVLAWANGINKDCEILLKHLRKGIPPDIEKLNKGLNRIGKQSQRILKAARFATKKNWKVNAEFREGDVLDFIRNYLQELKQWDFFKNIDIISLIPEKKNFITFFNPLEITILLDNLIVNSQKAKAKTFYVSVQSCTKDRLILHFDDNGSGLHPTINDPIEIFERGFTTTDGSGIGLNHCADIAKEMRGSLQWVQSQQGGFALILDIPAIEETLWT